MSAELIETVRDIKIGEAALLFTPESVHMVLPSGPEFDTSIVAPHVMRCVALSVLITQGKLEDLINEQIESIIFAANQLGDAPGAGSGGVVS